MPAPVRDLIITPKRVRFQVAAEPVFNALQSMVLLLRTEQLSGLDEWITQTADALPKEVMDEHALIIWGLHYAAMPTRSFDSFDAYLEHLGSVDPLTLRDQLLDTYLELDTKTEAGGQFKKPTKGEIMKDAETFLSFLRSRFEEEHIFEDVERKAFELLSDPSAMRSRIFAHLTRMWRDYFEEEFERRRPIIEETVAGFSEIDLESMTDEQAVRFITGQFQEKLCDHFGDRPHIVFVPSPHAGPYSGTFIGEDTLWVTFNCRLPERIPQSTSKLSRAELLVWLSALADDARLQVLALLKERDELCSQEIISILETSQSTASRHLRQLSASGFIREHRTDAGKCYQLNNDRFDETIKALETFIE